MYDVIKTYKKTPREIVEAFAKIGESASINESMPNKDGALNSRIKPIWPGIKMCGTAMTVQCGPADNIMLHKAISMVKPGDVLIVTNGQYDEAGGMFGGLMAAALKAAGGAGMVIEGACRDSMTIKELELPVFALNVSIKPTTKSIPGKINHPIIIGGILVNPGDLVFGDNDGVVVVPSEQAAEILAVVQTREAKEAEFLKKVLNKEITTFDGFATIYEKLGLKEEK